MAIQDITDDLFSIEDFEGLAEYLDEVKANDPDQKVKVGEDELPVVHIEAAFAEWKEYLTLNKGMVKNDPEEIVKHLEYNMADTGILNTNPALRETAIQCSQSFLK